MIVLKKNANLNELLKRLDDENIDYEMDEKQSKFKKE